MSGAQTIRLLLADVDGTLLTKDKVLTGAAKEVGSCATRHCVRHHQQPAQASAVTDSNENEGFAKAVRQFILRPAAA